MRTSVVVRVSSPVRRLFFAALILIVLGTSAALQSAPARADGVSFWSCNPGANCAELYDNPPGPTSYWCGNVYTQTTVNGYLQRCLHSK
jgi:hypothetical protein